MADKKKEATKKKDPLEGYGWDSGWEFIDDVVDIYKEGLKGMKKEYKKAKHQYNEPSTAEKIRRHDVAVKRKKKNIKKPKAIIEFEEKNEDYKAGE